MAGSTSKKVDYVWYMHYGVAVMALASWGPAYAQNAAVFFYGSLVTLLG